MSAKFIDVYPVVTQHPWTSADVRKVYEGSIPSSRIIYVAKIHLNWVRLAPAYPPLAHPDYASGLGKISAYTLGLAPSHLPRPLRFPLRGQGLGC